MNKGRLKNAAIRVLMVALWLMIWQIVSALTGLGFLFPGPVKVFLCLCGMLGKAETWAILFSTGKWVMAGVGIGIASGLVLGGIARLHPWVDAFFLPVVEVMKSLPVATFIILVLMWTGSGRVAMFISMVVVFPLAYQGIGEAIGSLSAELDEVAAVYGIGWSRRLRFIVLPQCVPYLRTIVRSSVGMGFKSGVAAEVIGLTTGSVGGEMYLSKLYLEGDVLLAWGVLVVLAVVVVQAVLLFLIGVIDRVLGRWAACNRMTEGMAEAENHGCGGLVDVEAVSKSYDGAAVLEGVSLHVSTGEILCLMGESGIGKTTLLRVIMGLTGSDSGICHVQGNISVVFQENRLCTQMSAIENICMCMPEGKSAAYGCRRLLLELLGEKDITRPVGELSTGMGRRCEIARALAVPSCVVLMDEPFAGLDSVNKKRAIEFILRHIGNRPLIITTHDADDVGALGARALVIDKKVVN